MADGCENHGRSAHGPCSKQVWIGPSVLNGDLSSLADLSVKLINSGADYLHLDVMDGHFVPNITFGHPVVSCLRPKLPSGTFLDLHMMVSEPEKIGSPTGESLGSDLFNHSYDSKMFDVGKWIEGMRQAGATQYTFHLEATDDVKRCIRKIREADMKVGLGIKPKTVVEEVFPYVDLVDMILVMTVEPGFGGQAFMADMMSKVKALREKYQDLNIEVDGGVSPKTIRECIKNGANMIVSGSAVTSADDPAAIIRSMRSTVVEL